MSRRSQTLPVDLADAAPAPSRASLELTAQGLPVGGVAVTLPPLFNLESLSGEWRANTSLYVRVNDGKKVYLAIATVVVQVFANPSSL